MKKLFNEILVALGLKTRLVDLDPEQRLIVLSLFNATRDEEV